MKKGIINTADNAHSISYWSLMEGQTLDFLVDVTLKPAHIGAYEFGFVERTIHTAHRKKARNFSIIIEMSQRNSWNEFRLY